MTTLIGIVVVVVVLIAGATVVVLALCAASAARDDMESKHELPAENDTDAPQGPRRRASLRLAGSETKTVARR